MPFLVPTVMEFALVSVDGETQDLSTAGKFRITDDGKAPPRLEVKPCDQSIWREARREDMEFMRRVMAQYT